MRAGEFDDMNNVLMLMDMDDVEADVHTYAIRLEACGVMATTGYHDDVRTLRETVGEVLDDMHGRGIDVDTVLTRAALGEEQVDMIQTALRCVDHCEDRLNKNEQNDGRGSSAVMRRLDECDSRVMRQVESELQGVVFVEPVVDYHSVLAAPNQSKQKQKLYLDKILENWRAAFLERLRFAQENISTKQAKLSLLGECIAFTKVIPPEELCDLVFDNIVPKIAAQPRGVSIRAVTGELGDLMYKRFCMTYLKKNRIDVKVGNICQDYINDDSDTSPRIKWEELSKG